jgi:hypothetical protein
MSDQPLASKDVAQGVISAIRSVLGRQEPYYCNEVRIPSERANALLEYITALERAAGETRARTRAEPDDDPASMVGSHRREYDGVPTDGQLLDQLEDAFYKADSGYVEQDIELRKSLAILLARYNSERPAPKAAASTEKGERHE